MADRYELNPVLNERWLKWAHLWVRHSDQLRRIVIGVVILVEASLLLYSGYFMVDYFVISRERDQQTLRDLTTTASVLPLHRALAPTPIAVPAVAVLPGSSRDGRFDVLVKFYNPNPNWVAFVEYRVGEAAPATVLLLNDEERFSVAPAAVSGTAARPEVALLAVRWQRLRDPAAFTALKPRFVVSDVRFIPGRGVDRAGASLPSQVLFTVANESANGFWNVGFTVVLLQGGQPVAARALTLEQVRSGEQRDVAINLHATIAGVTEVLVLPDVDIVDEGNIIREPGEPVRF